MSLKCEINMWIGIIVNNGLKLPKFQWIRNNCYNLPEAEPVFYYILLLTLLNIV